MADFKFSVKMTEQGDLMNEFNDAVNGMRTPVHFGLTAAGTEMAINLEEHIRQDWYEAWGEPLIYKRRTDFPQYGTPLGDPDNITATVSGMTLSFLFEPDGKHAAKNWSRNLSPDELINVIQTDSGWKYPPDRDKKGREIRPRPFWNNFVEEQRNGLLFAAFEEGFSGRGYDLVREGGTKDLDFPASESMLDGGINEGSMTDEEWLDSIW